MTEMLLDHIIVAGLIQESMLVEGFLEDCMSFSFRSLWFFTTLHRIRSHASLRHS